MQTILEVFRFLPSSSTRLGFAQPSHVITRVSMLLCVFWATLFNLTIKVFSHVDCYCVNCFLLYIGKENCHSHLGELGSVMEANFWFQFLCLLSVFVSTQKGK